MEMGKEFWESIAYVCSSRVVVVVSEMVAAAGVYAHTHTHTPLLLLS